MNPFEHHNLSGDASDFDARISKSLRETPVPEGLRAALLHPDFQKRHARKTRAQKTKSWALAACAAVLVVAAFFGLDEYRDRQRFIVEKDFRAAMAVYVHSVTFRLDHKTDDLAGLLQYLRPAGEIPREEIPPRLQQLIPKGCKVVSWDKQSVSLICLWIDRPGGRLVHLFAIDRRDVPLNVANSLEESLRLSSLQTKGWQGRDHVYLLVAGDAETDLDAFFGS